MSAKRLAGLVVGALLLTIGNVSAADCSGDCPCSSECARGCPCPHAGLQADLSCGCDVVGESVLRARVADSDSILPNLEPCEVFRPPEHLS